LAQKRVLTQSVYFCILPIIPGSPRLARRADRKPSGRAPRGGFFKVAVGRGGRSMLHHAPA
jgi:hypothetical protein